MIGSRAVRKFRRIGPRGLHEIQRAGKPIDLIDVRTPAEFRALHATPARLLPLGSLDPAAVMANRPKSEDPLYVICHSGSRNARACEAFSAAGYGDLVVNVEGGTQVWKQARLPVERGKSVLPLARQVRIVVGLIVVTGTILGAFVNPWFRLIPGIRGVGLVFAGLTDLRPLASAIARMPWNQADHIPAPDSM